MHTILLKSINIEIVLVLHNFNINTELITHLHDSFST